MEIGGILMKKLLALVTGLVLVFNMQPAMANTQNLILSMSTSDGPREVFSQPFSAWVMVQNSSRSGVAGQALNITVSGPATLEFPQGLISDATGLVNYNVIPNLGSAPQDIVVTAQIVGTSTSLSVRTRFSPMNQATFRANMEASTSDGPAQFDTVLSGKTVTFTLNATTDRRTPIPRLPITWSVSGLGFVGSGEKFTDSLGKGKIAVLLGSQDEGTLTVTATVNYGSGQATVTKTVLVQRKPLVLPVLVDVYSSEQRVNVVVQNAKGSAVAVKIGSKWIRFTPTSEIYSFDTPATAAELQVSVFVNGELQYISTLQFAGFEKPSPKPTPTATPTAPSASTPSSTVTCRSGQKVLTVTGIKPSCPSGFKVSKQAMPASAKTVTCKKPGFTIRMAKPMTTCPAGYKK
jgi:hypothetical protein